MVDSGAWGSPHPLYCEHRPLFPPFASQAEDLTLASACHALPLCAALRRFACKCSPALQGKSLLPLKSSQQADSSHLVSPCPRCSPRPSTRSSPPPWRLTPRRSPQASQPEAKASRIFFPTRLPPFFWHSCLARPRPLSLPRRLALSELVFTLSYARQPSTHPPPQRARVPGFVVSSNHVSSIAVSSH